VVYLNGSGHIVANNLLEAINAAGVEGVNMDINSSYCKAVGNIIHDVISGGVISGQYNLVQGNIMFNTGSNFSNVGTGNIVSNNNLA